MKRPYYTMTSRMVPDWRVQKGGYVWEDNTLNANVGSQVDVASWSSPPHEYLANLAYDPASRGGLASKNNVLYFTRMYGPFEPEEDGVPFFLELEAFHNVQKQLREAWREQDHHLIFKRSWWTGGFENNPEHQFRVNWEVKRGSLQMKVSNCKDYLSVLLARDIAEKHAKVCRNPKCHTPFFVAQRTDVKYCSHSCAVVINVKNFRQRHKKKARLTR
jgi:hypothetical protein